MSASKMEDHLTDPLVLKRAAAVGVFLAACLAIGCGGETAPAAQATVQESQQMSACDLMTAAEIQEVTGRAPGDAVPRELGSGFLECRWMLPDGSDQLAYAAYRPAGAPLTYEAWVEEYKASMGDDFDPSMLEDYELISEGGNQFALFADGDFLGGMVQVYVDGRALIVGTMRVEGMSNQVLAMGLAARAQPRLP